ncbi:helix-turn-helix domain-containing protein [Bifidobacterium miconisargentati]|uniref:helix-turn-helix domain-containing protein n=1 Tax=Bifidobacterium miconisargentati TaxID=2834437 RepID=UPI001BDBB7CC|nr:helix-turn-helix domain-containing protein [Bifidobacterium miconisargentati]MBW3089251.1 helix-turn-helix domain-containing protein [Bifidobacterium miconisargentati]
MTVVTMVWVHKHVHDVRNAAKTVLAYLALRAHFDDGTASWPSIETIAQDCGLGERTVQRAIRLLIDKGYLELGQQGFSAFNPKTGKQVRADRRSVVWNVICKESDLPEEDVEDPNARSMDSCVRYARKVAAHRAALRSDTGMDSGLDKMTPREDGSGQNGTPCGAPESEPVDKMSRKMDKMAPNNTGDIHNPSAPTGHLPASGAAPGTYEQSLAEPMDKPAGDSGPDDAWTPPTSTAATSPVPESDDAGRILGLLSERRSALGLTTPQPGAADLAAVDALLRRFDAVKGLEPAVVVVTNVLERGLRNPYWLKRIDTGRRFARHFDEIRNDTIIDGLALGRRDVAVQAADPAMPAQTPEAKARRLVEDSAILRSAEPDSEIRHAYDRTVADRLAAGMSPGDVVVWLAERLTAAHPPAPVRPKTTDDREVIRRELERARRLNGGHMFAGSSGRVLATAGGVR